MSRLLETPEPLYLRLANSLEGLVENGTYGAGDRMPSVREVKRDFDVSVTTVMEAYRILENRNVIETRPQSGHYVRPRLTMPPNDPASEAQPLDKPYGQPYRPSRGELIFQVIQDITLPGMFQFGAVIPNGRNMPGKALGRLIGAKARNLGDHGMQHLSLQGSPNLRAAICKRMLHGGARLAPEHVIVTHGCTEAFTLALRAVCPPGGTVIVESPTFYNYGLVLDELGLKMLEVPATPREGISLEALQFALEQHPVSACLLNPNYNNPLGFCMPEPNKRALLELTTRHRVPVIEDDVFGELNYFGHRAPMLKSFDTEDWVILCSSISKTLAQGMRVGWVASERFYSKLANLKMASTVGNFSVVQEAVADYLEHGGFDRHLRRLTRIYEKQTRWAEQKVCELFPAGTHATHPHGGNALWVALPEPVDTLELYRRCKREKISIAPGEIFSQQRSFKHCLRLNTAFADEASEPILRRIGQLAGELMTVEPPAN